MTTPINSLNSGSREKSEYRPGDVILDRYLPSATAEERETARENLYRFARLLIRVHERLALDNPQHSIRTDATSALESESALPSV